MADSIVQAAAEFTAAADRPDTDTAPASNQMTITVPVMTAALLGEQVINGLDIARAAGLPWAILLVGFGRTGQWTQILCGKIIASGRKPWLGLGFGRLLVSP